MMNMYLKRPRVFYVCSFGGCGSWMLARYLAQFGTVHHVHSRRPPARLTRVENEWFTDTPLTAQEIADTDVIYIYRNPVAALASVARRFPLEKHLANIQCVRPKATLEDAVREGDVFGLGEFFCNYVVPGYRNYRILCIKYESFFDRFDDINAALRLPPTERPVQKESAGVADDRLQEVYADLQEKMDMLPFLWMH